MRTTAADGGCFFRRGKAPAWTVLLLFALTASACGKALPPTPSTPSLELAGTYTPGQNDIPSGKYLVVEAWTNTDGKSSNGQCPNAAMMDLPTYEIHADALTSYGGLYRDYSPALPAKLDPSKAIGFFGDGSSRSGDMGGGASSRLTAIETLPATPNNSIFTIYSIYADGSIVVKIDAQTYRMKPGDRWVQYYRSRPDSHCQVVDTATFTNHGLFDGTRINVTGDLLLPGPTPTP